MELLVRGAGRVGASLRGVAHDGLTRIAFVGRVAAGPLELEGGAWRHIRRVTVQQVYFTAAKGLLLVATIALLVGGTVILQAYAQAVRLGLPHMPARLLVSIIGRELGPLITAMVILGRSGTAVAAELATSTVLGETEALETFGVDPAQAFVLPRVLGFAVSAALLTVYFDAIAFASGIVAAQTLANVPIADSATSLALVLTPNDLILTLAKGILFGGGIALICGYYGLRVRKGQPADVPRAVTSAVVASLLFIFIVSAVLSLVVYA